MKETKPEEVKFEIVGYLNEETSLRAKKLMDKNPLI
jgi:hypothetical protein